MGNTFETQLAELAGLQEQIKKLQQESQMTGDDVASLMHRMGETMVVTQKHVAILVDDTLIVRTRRNI